MFHRKMLIIFIDIHDLQFNMHSNVKYNIECTKPAGSNMYSAWGCPHEVEGICMRVKHRHCDPGMKGCILHGRFTFSDPDKNSPAIKRKLAESKRNNK